MITLGSHKRLPSFLFLCEQPIRIYAWCIVSTAVRPAASLHLQPCQQHLCIGSQALRFSHSGIFASAARPCGSVTAAPCQQKLPDGSPWQQFLPYSYPPRCCQHLCHSAASLQTLRHGQQHLPDGSSPRRPASKSSPMALRHGVPGQQKLRHDARAGSISATAAPPASSIFPMDLRYSAPASNKPHPAEKSAPVWLPIWCTWAGFANSQLRCATFHSNYSYKCTSSLLPTWRRCSDRANLSAHLRRLPTPPPYLRRMRLSPGRWRRSCKSPRARILVLGTSGAHWPARWPQFELTERVTKS